MHDERDRILIVDDAGEVVVLCVNMLQSLGYVVKAACRGEAGLELVQRETFDLAIIDYKMPDMNGFEVFERARALRPDMRCMLLTGHGTADVVEDAAALGFRTVLLKPFTRDQLRQAVNDALGDRAGRIES